MIASYTQTLTMDGDISYVGSKCLFDPNYVPKQIFSRKKQAKLLHGLIMDALEDGYNTNINLYGLKGSGKNLQINHFFKWLNLYKQEIRKEDPDSNPYFLIRINCENKDIGQIFFTVINDLIDNLNINVNLTELISGDAVKLWNLFQLTIKHLKSPLILYLQKTEHLKSYDLNKLFTFAKSTKKIYILSAMNTGSQYYSFKQFDNIDQKIQFSIYNPKELTKISDDRCKMAFKEPLHNELIDLIVDYVCEFSMKVPGECVKMIKQIYYPHLQKNNCINPDQVRSSTQYFFDNVSIDVFTLTDFINNSSFEEQLFLEYLVGYFQTQDHAYIPFIEIKNAYLMSVEELSIKTNWNDFYHSVGKFINSNILLPNKVSISQVSKMENGIHLVPYFLPIPVEEIDELLKYSFGMLD